MGKAKRVHHKMVAYWNPYVCGTWDCNCTAWWNGLKGLDIQGERLWAMIFSGSEMNRSFRPGHEKHKSGADSLTDIEPSDLDTDSEEVFLCRSCYQLVTTSGQRMDINGVHSHSFANPHGIVFEIGCFRAAPGCAYSEESSGEFTWFKGFRWKVAVCRSCLSHLGWLFVSTDKSFNGLILENLIVCKQGDESS